MSPIRSNEYQAIPHLLLKEICEYEYNPDPDRARINEIMNGRTFICETCGIPYDFDSALIWPTRIVCDVCDSDLAITTITTKPKAATKEPMFKDTQVDFKLSQIDYVRLIRDLGVKHTIAPELAEELRQDWAEEACLQTTSVGLDEYIKLRKVELAAIATKFNLTVGKVQEVRLEWLDETRANETDATLEEYIKIKAVDPHKYVKLSLPECNELIDLLETLHARFRMMSYHVEAEQLLEQIEQIEDHVNNNTFDDDSAFVKVSEQVHHAELEELADAGLKRLEETEQESSGDDVSLPPQVNGKDLFDKTEHSQSVH